MITKAKRLVAALMALCITFTIGQFRVSAAATHTFGVEGTFDYDAANEVFTLLNELRAGQGLPALTMDAGLMETAMQRAAEVSIYFDHTRPNGEQCFTAFPSGYNSLGENIASGQTSPEDVMNAWTDSEGHYSNMIEPAFTAVGIGCFYQEDGGIAWVQVFTGGSTPNSTAVSGKVNGMKVVTALESILGLTIRNDSIYYGPNLSSLTMTVGTSGSLNLYVNGTKVTPLYAASSNTNAASLTVGGTLSADGIGDASVKLGLSDSFYQELTVTVVQAQPAGTLSFTPITAIAQTLAEAKLGGTFTDPHSGETISGTITWDAGEDAVVFRNREYTWTFTPDNTVSYKTVSGSLTPYVDNNPNWFPFRDVASDAWYRSAVELVYQCGWFTGTSATEYSPDAKMTAAMMANVLYHMAGDPAVSTSSDEWYAKPMTWAQNAGILKNIPGITHDTIVTREQMAVMMYNYINATGTKLNKTGASANYSDAAEISSWAVDAVAAMYEYGILTGRADGSYDPQGTATRAEVSQMFANFYSAI